MGLDFSKCRIINPRGEQLLKMYKILWGIFPYDRPVYEELMQNNDSLYTLKNFALFQGNEFLGNAGLMPLKIYYQNKIIEIIGVGAVATMPSYRNQGIAKYLMQHCMQIIDEQQLPAALFTEVEAVYKKHGFESLNQVYLACEIKLNKLNTGSFEFEILESLYNDQLSEMKDVYENSFILDGKIVRDKNYWRMYQMFFNPYPKPLIILCRKKGALLGYLRFDAEDDRVTVTEMWSKEGESVLEGLLSEVWKFANVRNLKVCTIALSANHPIYELLKNKGIKLGMEPKGVRRESFMMRAVKNKHLDDFLFLQWSLADKF